MMAIASGSDDTLSAVADALITCAEITQTCKVAPRRGATLQVWVCN